MSLTPEQLGSFQDFAAFIYEQVPDLSEALAPEAERSSIATRLMGKALAAGRDSVSLDEVKKEFDGLDGAQSAVYSATYDLVQRTRERLGGPNLNPKLPEIADSMRDDTLASQKLELMEFGLANIRFFHGMALMSLHTSLSEYIDLCEAYLGHEVGSHEWRKRVLPVIRELGLAGLALVLPPAGFTDAAVEVFRQARNTPERAAMEAQIRFAEGRERQVLLKRSLEGLEAGASFTDGVVNTSVDGVLEARAEFTKALKRWFE